MLKFYLWNVPGLTLLVPMRSGTMYANQTGGYHCLEDSLEGIVLPLFNTFEGIDQEQLLHKHFTTKWSGWCAQGIDLETAEFVDDVLRAAPYTSWLRVDRDRLSDCHESWIFVRPVEFSNTETIEFDDFRFETAIITWPNSD